MTILKDLAWLMGEREPRQHTPQFLQRPAAPQRAGAGADDDDFED